MELAKELGFKVRDYDGYAAAVDFGTEGKEVGILSHIDVVPAGNGWTRKPFLPEICDGKMYGRGTVDDKGPLVACLYAMKAIQESGLPSETMCVTLLAVMRRPDTGVLSIT